jgi:chromosome segregation ATPase
MYSYDYETLKAFIKQNVKFKDNNQRKYFLNTKLKKKDMDDVNTQLCYKLYESFVNNGNVIQQNNDDELNKLRREVGHLKQINAKYKIQLENKKNDYEDLQNEYFDLLDRKEKIENDCKTLDTKVKNLNRQLQELKEKQPKPEILKKSYKPAPIVQDPDNEKNPVEDHPEIKRLTLECKPYYDAINLKTLEIKKCNKQIDDEMNKENINFTLITTILEPKRRNLEEEIRNINYGLRPIQNKIKNIVNQITP